jgi:hypothetical protein
LKHTNKLAAKDQKQERKKSARDKENIKKDRRKNNIICMYFNGKIRTFINFYKIKYPINPVVPASID